MLIFKSTNTLSGAIWKFGLHLFCITYLSFIMQKRFTWLVDCQVEWLEIVRYVTWNWYHFTMKFFNQTLYLVFHCPLNTSTIKSHVLAELRSSSSFLFLTSGRRVFSINSVTFSALDQWLNYTPGKIWTLDDSGQSDIDRLFAWVKKYQKG